MKEKWLGFATDENDVYGYTNDAAAGPYNLEIGTSGLRVEAGQAQYFKSI